MTASGEKWRKLRGLGPLNQRQLAVVRELFKWREETASRTNRPPRSFIRDDLIIEIARRNPARERDLRVIRGLPHRELSVIVRVVEEARALPMAQCPTIADREQDPPQLQLVTSVMTAVLGDSCVRNYLATNLVATSQDIKLLVRAHLQGTAPPENLLLVQGWRGRHVLPDLQAILEGRRWLRIANVGADTPFDYGDVDHPCITPQS